MRPRKRPCGSAPRASTLDGLIAEYLRERGTKIAEENARWSGDPREAALSVSSEGKHPHQWRIPTAVLERGARRLAKLDLDGAQSFDRLHELVAGAARETPGLGPVWAYDVATRIGAKQRLFPERIYLHAGTKDGAKAMGLDHRAASVEVPRELRRLTAAQAEDFLCICKDELARVSRGTRSPLTRRA